MAKKAAPRRKQNNSSDSPLVRVGRNFMRAAQAQAVAKGYDHATEGDEVMAAYMAGVAKGLLAAEELLLKAAKDLAERVMA